jgi:CHAD domain-containing protein
MRETLERELKLDVDTSFRLPPLEGEPLRERVFTSVYHDTPVRSLARSGITLRRRVEGADSLWQLNLPQTGGARTGLEAAGGADGPPSELARLLRVHLRHGAPEKVASLRTHRSGIRVLDGRRRVADVTVDAVDVLTAGEFVPGFVEVEAELLDGDGHDLARLRAALLDAGARESGATSKLFRVLPAPVETEPGATLGEQLRWLLRSQLHAFEAHDPGTRLGDDPEDVHRFRVATRRARALIRASGPLLDGLLAPLGDELKWLGGVLGDVRDLDVLLERLTPQVEELDDDAQGGRALLDGLGWERVSRRTALLGALESERYLDRLLRAFDDALVELPDLDPAGGATALAEQSFARLRKAARRLAAEPTDDELHELRRRAKRARYTAELAAFDGGKKLDRYVETLKDFQDVVGEHQDLVVAERRLRELVGPASDAAAVRLIDRGRARRLELRDTIPEVLARVLKRGARVF